MKTILALFLPVIAFSPACSSSSSGSGAPGNDGGLGQDAPSSHDAQGILDSSDGSSPADATGGDAPTEASAPKCVSDAGDPAPTDFANVPTCAAGTCMLAGTLGGQSVSQTYPSKNWDYANGTAFNCDFGTGGHVYLTLSVPVPNGGTSTTAGTMHTPSEGPQAGGDLCFASGSEMQFEADDALSQVRFIARCIDGSCTGTPVAIDGQLEGCCAK